LGFIALLAAMYFVLRRGRTVAMSNFKTAFVLALMVGVMGISSFSQAKAFEPFHDDINGYSGGVKYDDMFDDRYTWWDRWQNNLVNGKGSKDPDVGYYKGVMYDDVLDDRYTETDRIQDKANEITNEIQYDAGQVGEQVTRDDVR
jgi:hypothetical protein